jgi:hypothetical protein
MTFGNPVKMQSMIQDCNINLLVGSGLSNPYLATLGNIENLLTALSLKSIDEATNKLVKVSLYKKFFDGVILNNIDILNNEAASIGILDNYKYLLKTFNSLLLKRKSTILNKQINIFTTNIDIFLEKALENARLEYCDGFNGRFNPVYSLSNFNKSYFKKSLHYENSSEIPVFNLLKLHGSLTWKLEHTGCICFSHDIEQVNTVKQKAISLGRIVEILDTDTIDDIIAKSIGIAYTVSHDDFLKEYEKLFIVNPTKEKFKYTLLNQTYYELLRIFSNELEKTNSILFVMGFSFADEHVREIVMRVANSNPTLNIYIIAYDSNSKRDIENRLDLSTIRNNNIIIVGPPQKSGIDEYKYSFDNINTKLIGTLLPA